MSKPIIASPRAAPEFWTEALGDKLHDVKSAAGSFMVCPQSQPFLSDIT